MGSPTVRKRIVVCIDGTWYDGNGKVGHGTSNNSNCFRIYASIQRGLVRDKDNNEIHQVAKYFTGIGVGKSRLDKFNDGLTGAGCTEQAWEIYRECLKQAPNEDDEIWLFGFSRGAYVARVVATLLHKIPLRNPPADNKTPLEELKSIVGNKSRNATEWIMRTENGRSPPKIMFLGLFDTVKQTAAENDVDITSIGPETQIRHALALNEERSLFPILHFESSLTLNDTSRCIQAWFVGAHADMGGGTARDGLSLYPLQWMLIECRNLGLVLQYNPPRHVNKNLITNPLELAFPEPLPAIQDAAESQAGHTNADPLAPEPWTFRYSNGLIITMFDLRFSHKHKSLQQEGLQGRKLHNRPTAEETVHHIYINYGPPPGAWSVRPRKIFSTESLGTLLQYQPSTSGGTVIHPSVYFLLETYTTLGIGKSFTSLQRVELEVWKDKQLTFLLNDSAAPFDPWLQNPIFPNRLGGSCRILICGNTGVGKSTLLNRVFGVNDLSPVSTTVKGRHNIELAFEDDQHPGIIIHDSEGFQAGSRHEVVAIQSFLKLQTRSSNPRDNIDAIWLCIEANSSRPVQTAISSTLKAVAEIAPAVPIVVVGTKMDEFQNNTKADEDSDILSEQESIWRSQLETGLETKDFWPRLDTRFAFVSKYDENSIKTLVQTTVASLRDGEARQGIVAAQIPDLDAKIDLAIDQTLMFLRAAVSTASFGAGLAVSRRSASLSISRHLCEKIAHACFGLPKAMMDHLTAVLNEIVWRNLGAFMSQSLSQATVIWGGVTVLTLTTLIGGIPLALGAPLLDAPVAARIVVKCACDLILILERSFKDGGKFLTKEKIEFVASIYMKDEIEDDGQEKQQLRRQAVHGAINDVFPRVSSLAIRTNHPKGLASIRVAIKEIIEKYRIQREVLDDAEPNPARLKTGSAGASMDIEEDQEDIDEFLSKK